MIYTSTIRREQLLDINCYDGAVSNLAIFKAGRYRRLFRKVLLCGKRHTVVKDLHDPMQQGRVCFSTVYIRGLRQCSLILRRPAPSHLFAGLQRSNFHP